MFIFRGAHVEQQLLLWRFIHHLPSPTKWSRITPSQRCKPAAGITETLVRTGCCWSHFFLQGLLGHSLQNTCWLLPTPLQNFRETFANKSPIRRPQPSAGGTWDEAPLLEAWLLHLGFVSRDFRNGYSTWNQNYQNISKLFSIHGTISNMIISVQGTTVYRAST